MGVCKGPCDLQGQSTNQPRRAVRTSASAGDVASRADTRSPKSTLLVTGTRGGRDRHVGLARGHFRLVVNEISWCFLQVQVPHKIEREDPCCLISASESQGLLILSNLSDTTD